MAVAFDAASESHTGTTGSASEASFTWEHDPVGTPRGVLVFVFVNANADDVTSVTYEGATLNEIPLFATDTTDEPGRTYAFFLGTSVPTADTATVVVNRVNNADVMYAVCFTVTAADDTFSCGWLAENNNQALAEENIDDGTLSGTDSLRFAGTHYGGNGIPGTGASSTAGPSIDFGARTIGTVRETTAGTGARPVGFSASSEDVAALYVAIRESIDYTAAVVSEDGYEQDLTNWFPGEGEIYVGQDGSGAYRIGCRVLMGRTDMAGMTVLSAPLRLQINTATGTLSGTIRAEKVANASAITARQPNTWGTLTTASVALPATPGTGLESIDIAAIIQELIDEASYVGQAIALVLDENVAATNFIAVEGIADTGSDLPIALEINFEEEGAEGFDEEVEDIAEMGDSVVGFLSFVPVSVSDNILLGDQTTTAVLRSATDVVSLGDSAETRQVFTPVSASDGLRMGDLAQQGYARSVSEGIRMGENLDTVLTMDSGPDIIRLGDSVRYGAGRQVSDVVLFGDIAARVGATAASATDRILLGDTLAGTAGRYQTDRMLLGDSATFTGGYYTGAVTDVIRMGDISESGLTHIRFSVDIVLLGDTVTETPHHVRGQSDTVVLSDAAAVGTLARAVSDSIKLGDSLSVTPHYVRAAADILLLVDSASAETTGPAGRTVTDRILLGDLVSTVGILLPASGDVRGRTNKVNILGRT